MGWATMKYSCAGGALDDHALPDAFQRLRAVIFHTRI